MLHILWMILKIILIVLASLVGLLLVILLLILFCPIRYKGRGEKGKSAVRGEVNISWLFHIVSVWAGYKDGESWMDVRLFGISLMKAKEFFAKFRRKKNGEELTEEEAVPQLPGEEAEPDSELELKPEREEIVKAEPESEAEQEEEPQGPFYFLGRFFRSIGRFFKRVFKGFMKVISLFWTIPQKVFGIVRKISLTISSFCAKIDWWEDFLGDERTRGAISLGWGQVKKLLCHIAPRQVRGNVTFGFEDPSSTGQVLALLGATCPIHKNVVSVTPVFDEKVLEGHLMIKGRIYLVMLVKAAILLYFNKDIKYVIKVMKK